MQPGWKCVHSSVIGTSHVESGEVCQDSHVLREVSCADDSILIAVCSDGAGSATHSDVGSRTVCQTIIDLVSDYLAEGGQVGNVGEVDVLGWIEKARSEIIAAANTIEAEVREFACTLLLSIIGKEYAVFAHIGDGAIVVLDESECVAVFWPQSGEYANTTNFVTDDKYRYSVQIQSGKYRVDSFAMFTDGLERMILDFSTQTVHRPFLDAFFKTIKNTCDVKELEEPLERFLNSEAVNDRTNDDKTLVLCMRV